jgi:hypothetical protein
MGPPKGRGSRGNPGPTWARRPTAGPAGKPPTHWPRSGVAGSLDAPNGAEVGRRINQRPSVLDARSMDSVDRLRPLFSFNFSPSGWYVFRDDNITGAPRASRYSADALYEQRSGAPREKLPSLSGSMSVVRTTWSAISQAVMRGSPAVWRRCARGNDILRQVATIPNRPNGRWEDRNRPASPQAQLSISEPFVRPVLSTTALHEPRVWK